MGAIRRQSMSRPTSARPPPPELTIEDVIRSKSFYLAFEEYLKVGGHTPLRPHTPPHIHLFPHTPPHIQLFPHTPLNTSLSAQPTIYPHPLSTFTSYLNSYNPSTHNPPCQLHHFFINQFSSLISSIMLTHSITNYSSLLFTFTLRSHHFTALITSILLSLHSPTLINPHPYPFNPLFSIHCSHYLHPHPFNPLLSIHSRHCIV